MTALLTVLLVCASACVSAVKVEGMMMAGLLMQPMVDDEHSQFASFTNSSDNYQHAEGCVVDYLESAGVSIVLIPFDMPLHTLTFVLDNLQFLLLPGGDPALTNPDGEPTPYQKRQHFILNYAKARNDAGKPLPVMGICLGFEAMLVSAAGNNCSVLQGGFRDDLIAHNMQIDTAAVQASRIWKEFAKSKYFEEVLGNDTQLYWHEYGITPQHFQENEKLMEEYRVIGTTKDKNGVEFVAAIEHKKYPFIGYQSHPESNAFRHREIINFIDRSKESIRFMNEMILKMVEIGRPQAKPYSLVPQLLISMTSTRTPSIIDAKAAKMYYERRILTDDQLYSEKYDN